MAKKTAIRALAKYLPLSVEFMDAVQIDNDGGAKADYAAFAMNPTEGVTIDGEAEDLGDRPQADEPIEEKQPVKEEPKDKPKSEPRSKAPAGDNDPFLKIKEQIENDLMDGAPVEATREFYKDQLGAMAEQAPKILSEIERRFAQIEQEGE